ncbi:hypothetical protein JKP88DRAFT_337167 [Tribonema minus]|uniref:Uncharacterized protein n=1 Tax=Tribonema minus TaxID=303371 RepID=A0A835YRM6_9STRA|nr:hypothetical protein JKP88DRAFT_337167 [Tribonema minus]
MTQSVQLGVVFNLAVTLASLCISLVVPWARYNHLVQRIPPAEAIYEAKTVGLWRCYGASCALKMQPRPFFWGGLLAIIFLALAVVLAMYAVVAEANRGRDTVFHVALAMYAVVAEANRGRDTMTSPRYPQRLHLYSLIALVLAPTIYALSTFHYMHGGYYMAGEYMALGAAGISAVLLALQYFLGPELNRIYVLQFHFAQPGYLSIGGSGSKRSPHRPAGETTALRV